MGELIKYTAQFAGGLVTAQVIEYVVHKSVLHEQGEKKGSWLGFHPKHHQRVSYYGTDSIYSKFFKLDIDRLKEAGMLFAPTIALNLLLRKKYPAFAAGGTVGSSIYLFVHALGHKYPEIGCIIMPNHMVHHYDNPHDNYGVTSGLIDGIVRLLNGKPAMSKEKKEQILQRGLRRYHQRKSQLEEATIEREAEQKEIFRQFGETLEHMVRDFRDKLPSL